MSNHDPIPPAARRLDRLYAPPEIGAPGKRRALAERRQLLLAGVFVLVMALVVVAAFALILPGLLGQTYRLEAEHGPRRVLGERAGERRESATGLALLALAADQPPPAADLASLRLPMRAVLLHHLGGRGLASWDMLGTLARLAPAPGD